MPSCTVLVSSLNKIRPCMSEKWLGTYLSNKMATIWPLWIWSWLKKTPGVQHVVNYFSDIHLLILFKLVTQIMNDSLHKHIIFFRDQIKDGRLAAILVVKKTPVSNTSSTISWTCIYRCCSNLAHRWWMMAYILCTSFFVIRSKMADWWPFRYLNVSSTRHALSDFVQMWHKHSTWWHTCAPHFILRSDQRWPTGRLGPKTKGFGPLL